MLVVFRPFVFRKRKSLKRGLRDTDSVCDAQATSPERAAIQHRPAMAEGFNFAAV
jgi:hypothetical protein